ncbi:unnamed protein product [Cunninghamella echinulata]
MEENKWGSWDDFNYQEPYFSKNPPSYLDYNIFKENNSTILAGFSHFKSTIYIFNHDSMPSHPMLSCSRQASVMTTLRRIYGNVLDFKPKKYLPCDAYKGTCYCNSLMYGEQLMSGNQRNDLLNSRNNGINNYQRHGIDNEVPNELKNAKKIAISHAWMSTSQDKNSLEQAVYWCASNGLDAWLDLIDLNGKWNDQYTADIYGEQVIIVDPAFSCRSLCEKGNWQIFLLSPWTLRGWTAVELMVSGNVWIWTDKNNVISLDEWIGQDGMNKLLDKRLLWSGIIGVPLKMIRERYKDGEFTSVIPASSNNSGYANALDTAWLVSILSARVWTRKSDMAWAMKQLTGGEGTFANIIKKADVYAGLWISTRLLGYPGGGDSWIPTDISCGGIRWPKEEVGFLLKDVKTSVENLSFRAWSMHSMKFFINRTKLTCIIVNKECSTILGTGELCTLYYGDTRPYLPNHYKINAKGSQFQFLYVLNCKHELSSEIPCNQCLYRSVICMYDFRIVIWTAIIKFNTVLWHERKNVYLK